MSTIPTIDDVLRLIHSSRITLGTEGVAQDDLEKVLQAAGMPYEREVILSSTDRIDFLIGDVGVEMKISGSPKAIFRQVERYTTHDRIGSMVLATNKAMKLPAIVGGKPAAVASLGRGWL
jgi:hypothetical protein